MTSKEKAKVATEEIIDLISKFAEKNKLELQEIIKSYSNVSLTLIKFICNNINEKNEYLESIAADILNFKTDGKNDDK